MRKAGHLAYSNGRIPYSDTVSMNLPSDAASMSAPGPKAVTLWIHDEAFSKEDVLIDESLFDENLKPGSLLELVALKSNSSVRDFSKATSEESQNSTLSKTPGGTGDAEDFGDRFDVDRKIRCLCIAKPAPADLQMKHPTLQVSITNNIANLFGFRNRSQVLIAPADIRDHTASHVEIFFKDIYLARSDMWRLCCSELVGKTVYVGQKVLFLGSVRVLIKTIHVKGRKVSTAFFDGTTLPIFRSEAARFVLFIQMSQEMWDFDSEGNGEILFNRVINGFLPDLFQRWSELEVKHLVSIVMFGRLEYTHHENDLLGRQRIHGLNLTSSTTPSTIPHKDFYRVVVTDMASAQWTTILDELKKDFRVFLRDICLQPVQVDDMTENSVVQPKITGLPSSALKGNILEAINIAASQFANDHVDRDLVRTGVSVVVVTAGTGVFEVDRDLLNLTSETLTNNGIGIDIVCLSKMPLHSAPLFKYRSYDGNLESFSGGMESVSESPRTVRHPQGYLRDPNLGQSSVTSSVIGSTPHSLSRYASSLASERAGGWCFGIPQWIDLSYWVPGNELDPHAAKRQRKFHDTIELQPRNKRFVPRVRMYEIQMQGTEDSGSADIAIPYMIETQRKRARSRRMTKTKKSSSHTPSTRSFSGSPTLVRRLGYELSESPVKPEGLLTSNAKQQGDVYNRMNEYDDSTFYYTSRRKPVKTPSKVPRLGTKSTQPESTPPNLEPSTRSLLSTNVEISRAEAPKSESLRTSADDYDRSITPAEKTMAVRGPQKSRVSRTISLAFKGFAPPARAVPSTEVKIEHAQAQPLQQQPVKARRKLTTSSGSTKSGPHLDSRPQSIHDLGKSDVEGGFPPSNSKGVTVSRPISIGTSGRKLNGVEVVENLPYGSEMLQPRRDEHESTREDEKENATISSEDNEQEIDSSAPASVPKTLLPFIRNVNASNPIKRDPNAVSLYGRWQHLYPRKPRAATVKWRSLCTPASVPLTTEQFPSGDELDKQYESDTYTVVQDYTNELLEDPQTRESLLQEMISIRLAHGYQLVVRPDVQWNPDSRPCSPTQFFAPTKLTEESNTIWFYMGNTIQKLSYSDNSHIRVTKYVRKADMKLLGVTSIRYDPLIRTILSDKYKTRTMSLTGFSEEYPWEQVDGYLAGAKKDFINAVQQLRFWRARFVLIPVEPPQSAYKLAPSMTDETEEEIHLRGISALTQLWQKNRYIPLEERGKFKPLAGRKRDLNPLEIIFRTLNPSEVVVTELDIAMEEPGDTHPTQLLPESELLDRETATVTKIAQAMQGEKGIEIKNRRWHFKLHYNCFRGEEFINWILQYFKDITTREEAVHFGNELMEHGLFQHVNGKHAFKDGHFFYSVEAEHRVQKTDPRQSWFPTSRRSDRSVPPTPISENVVRDSPLTVRSRSSSSAANEGSEKVASSITKGSGEKKRVSVSLSKMIRLDVDHRRRSSRLEVVNLHYDRVHNPENCYHLELSWLNVTSKLVEDAIVSWATQSEKYGLKLVEVPIAEASNISNYEPFRSPYSISLVTPPPHKPSSTNNTYFTATSFGPQAPQSSSADVHMYQKAILKRFNFVLDLESASEFPDDVEILYSWGKLEYRYTQFVHRSGVILAQITDDGSFILAANRLYNTRYAAVKSKEHTSRSAPAQVSSQQPTLQASGILGLNPPNTSSPAPSPMVRASADVLGTRAALASSNLASYTTPEAIKDELEAFCHDAQQLEAFYKEITLSMMASAPQRKSSSTSSSALRAFRPAMGSGMEDQTIPEIRLPERLLRSTMSDEEGSQGWRLSGGSERSRGDVERLGRPRPPVNK